MLEIDEMSWNRREIMALLLGGPLAANALTASPGPQTDNASRYVETLGWEPQQDGAFHLVSGESGSGTTALMMTVARYHLQRGRRVHLLTEDGYDYRKFLLRNLFVHRSLGELRSKILIPGEETIIFDKFRSPFNKFSSQALTPEAYVYRMDYMDVFFVVSQNRHANLEKYCPLNAPLRFRFYADTITLAGRREYGTLLRQLKNRHAPLVESLQVPYAELYHARTA